MTNSRAIHMFGGYTQEEFDDYAASQRGTLTARQGQVCIALGNICVGVTVITGAHRVGTDVVIIRRGNDDIVIPFDNGKKWCMNGTVYELKDSKDFIGKLLAMCEHKHSKVVIERYI